MEQKDICRLMLEFNDVNLGHSAKTLILYRHQEQEEHLVEGQTG